MTKPNNKVIFLDRDGVINVDSGYVHKLEDFVFTPGAAEALKELQDAGYMLAVVTGQSGIGRGQYSLEDMQAFNTHMSDLLAQSGVHFAALAYCPHHPDDGCDCRKPKRGMADQVVEQIGDIDWENSWMIGDKESDVGFGKNIGVKTVLLTSRYWQEADLSDKPDVIAADLPKAVAHIVS